MAVRTKTMNNTFTKEDLDELYSGNDNTEEYNRYNNMPMSNKQKIKFYEGKLRNLENDEKRTSEETKEERLQIMRDLYSLYYQEGDTKKLQRITKKGKALAGIKDKDSTHKKRTLTKTQIRNKILRDEYKYK